MRTIFLISLALVGSALALPKSPRVVVNWNDYFDSLIESFRQTIINSGNDPMTLPDVRDEFTVTILGTDFPGELVLSNGILRDVSIFSRAGDALADLTETAAEIKAGLYFNDLKINYTFLADIMGIGPTGELYAEIDDFIVEFDILGDLVTKELTLVNLAISSAGTLTVVISDVPFAELLDAIADVFTGLFHDQIVSYISDALRGLVAEEIKNWDLDQILGGGGAKVVPRPLPLKVVPRPLPLKVVPRPLPLKVVPRPLPLKL